MTGQAGNAKSRCDTHQAMRREWQHRLQFWRMGFVYRPRLRTSRVSAAAVRCSVHRPVSSTRIPCGSAEPVGSRRVDLRHRRDPCSSGLRRDDADSPRCRACDWLEHESRADWDVTHALRPTRLGPPACATVFEPAPPPPLLPTTGNAGDACVGTAFTAFGDLGANTSQSYVSDVSFPPADSRLCQQDKGLFCDGMTRVCTAGRGLGEACIAPEQCDATRTYCDISTHTCATRVPVGAACTPTCATGPSCLAPAPGVDSGLTARTNQCEAPGFCHTSTSTCVVLGELGAVCSPPSRTSTFPPCRSGVCLDDKCASPISPLCGA